MAKPDPHIPVENGKYYLCQTEDTEKVMRFVGTVIIGSDGQYYQVTMATFERNPMARVWFARGKQISERAYQKAYQVQALKQALLTQRIYARPSMDEMPNEANRAAAAEVARIEGELKKLDPKLVGKVMPTVK